MCILVHWKLVLNSKIIWRFLNFNCHLFANLHNANLWTLNLFKRIDIYGCVLFINSFNLYGYNFYSLKVNTFVCTYKWDHYILLNLNRFFPPMRNIYITIWLWEYINLGGKKRIQCDVNKKYALFFWCLNLSVFIFGDFVLGYTI